MPRRHRLVGVAVAVLVAVLLPAPAAGADAGFAGRWVSDSQRDSGFGYTLTLKPGDRQGADYVGLLRFTYPDGRIGSSVRVTGNGMGNSLVLTAREGSFDRAGRTLRAEVDRRSGVLTFVNCLERLRLVMPWARDSDCVLRR